MNSPFNKWLSETTNSADTSRSDQRISATMRVIMKSFNVQITAVKKIRYENPSTLKHNWIENKRTHLPRNSWVTERNEETKQGNVAPNIITKTV